MENRIHLTWNFPVHPDLVWNFWTDETLHAQVTGANAKINPVVGGTFELWDNYISGRFLELTWGEHCLQYWRTTDFSGDAPNAQLELRLRETPGGCELELTHSAFPPALKDVFIRGWEEYYHTPLRAYFES